MMLRDVSACNTYNYGDALYWDARYVQEGGSFDWYQRYSALHPFVRRYVPTTSKVLMVGCGNAVMSEDMVKDGYEEIVNVDISAVAIDMMKKKYEHVPQMKYLQMDVRDMSFFPDESFDAVIDKGNEIALSLVLFRIIFHSLTSFSHLHSNLLWDRPVITVTGTLDSLMCGTNAPICAAQMLGEVNRLLKNGGVYMLITYGDPTARMPHLSRSVFNWKIELYIIRHGFKPWKQPLAEMQGKAVYNTPLWWGPSPDTAHSGSFSAPCCPFLFLKLWGRTRPGFQKHGDPPNVKSCLEPIPLTEKGLLPADYVMADPDSHFIYICKKIDESVELSSKSTDPLTADLL
ncbi:putative protein transport protein SEC31-like isoform 1 [Capsicum annuum]|nr:putative protein transport protein SEC31-like isoform 1 [Capsicum annuum]